MENLPTMPNNLAATAGWDAVPQLETTTPNRAGPGGEMNQQAQALLNRTEWLKDVADASMSAMPRQATRPILIEQHFSGFYGRGMLASETNNLATEQGIIAPASTGAFSVSVADTSNYVVGSTVTIKHANGRYWSYFVASKTAADISVRPALKYDVDTSSRIERTWFNRAHPGKFYMRHLAQRIASVTEIEGATPKQRLIYTTYNDASDTAVAVGGITPSYFAESNTGSSGGTDTPVRFGIGQSVFVPVTAAGHGIETASFPVGEANLCVANVLLIGSSQSLSIAIQAIDNTGAIVSERVIPSDASITVLRRYQLLFRAQNASTIKIRIVTKTAVSSNFIVDSIDVFSIDTGGFVIDNPNSTIVCLGDSWTAGDLGNTAEREPIPQQLALELPYATIINKGVGGQKVWDMLARFDTDVAPYKPQYVVVDTGTNESYNPASGTFEPNGTDYWLRAYRDLIGKIQSIGARPILIGVPALAEDDPATTFTNFTLNSRAKAYVRVFDKALAPVISGAASTSYPTYPVDATITSGSVFNASGMRSVYLNYASGTDITDIAGGVEGQIVQLQSANGNARIASGTNIFLNQAAAFFMQANSTLTLIRRSGKWYEIARSNPVSQSAEETASATPSAGSGAVRVLHLNYAAATTVTNLVNGTKDQMVTLIADNGNATLANGIFKLAGGANLALTANSAVTLLKLDPALTSAWVEVSRSIK